MTYIQGDYRALPIPNEPNRGRGHTILLHIIKVIYANGMHKMAMTGWEKMREQRIEQQNQDRVAEHQAKVRGDTRGVDLPKQRRLYG